VGQLTTIGNGGDNLAIWVPLFASAAASSGGSGVGVAVTVAVFYVGAAAWLVGAWCTVACGGRWLAAGLSRWGGVVVPLLLVGLGLYILSGSVVFGVGV
jgi:cadmium resistance protein CadD (predicted permease)